MSKNSLLSHFFSPAGDNDYSNYQPRQTVLLVPEKNSDGSVSVVSKLLDSIVDPLSVLNFEDFKLQNLLKNGVSYKAIQISPDVRVGFDDEIIAFNDKLASMADKLFVQSSNPQ